MSLFDENIITGLDWSKAKAQYRNNMSPENLPDGYKVRALHKEDFQHGYCDLLSNLTKVGEVSEEAFNKQFDLMAASKSYYTVVVEHLESHQVVGTVTMLLEHKFIHSAANRGRIEDIVVHPDHQGKQFGKMLLDIGILLAEQTNCYKLSLDCDEKTKAFYEKFNLTHKEDHRFMFVKNFD